MTYVPLNAEYKPGTLERFIQVLSILLESAVIWFPLGVGTVAIIYPCSPLFLSSLFCDLGLISRIMGIATAALETWLWLQIAVYAVYYGAHVILVDLTYFWKKLHRATEAKSFRLYNEMQVLERVLNATLKGRLMCFLIFDISLIQYFCGCVLLTIAEELAAMEISLFVLTYIDASAFLFTILTLAGRIFVKSERLIRILGRSRLSKFKRRQVKSWRPMRVEFGQNFVDALTPLVVQGNVMRETISVAVVYKNK